MTNRTEQAHARLAGVKEGDRRKIIATAYASSAQTAQARKALAQKMRARIQQRTPGQ